ncbi:hypothetical protein [Novosphingobium sp. MMS21-SN21R]|uniref:hypothetical protein n=1 Tax=Novosphingobium sp. MMS21-SN21R TaxID=2969298 RepID=UPI002886CD80|nr:hypothetical protein [Novosphingobium sp. MMS21-SN21R]MDT0507439.1 hypothetical protein [Novosphingobium sp. MMS21-SN21R]
MAALVEATLQFDERVKCFSLITAVSIGDYLKLVAKAYADRGGLQYQREALRTTTARRIRNRMISDIKRGAVLPPVVIGVVVDTATLKKIPEMQPAEVVDLMGGQLVDSISIIDGMQRTTALMDAVEQDACVADKPIRIECWIAETTDSLIYRMLVLNTGQVPWNLSRQLQVVYAPLVEEMKSRIKFARVLNREKAERRTRAGEYAPDNLVELYIAFALRKTDVDTQQTLADEFSRLDMTDALAEDQYNHFFYPVLQMMLDLDLAFSRLDNDMPAEVEEAGGKKVITKGRGIFDSQPARIGFVVASAIAILGRIGMERELKESEQRLEEVTTQVAGFVAKLSQMDVDHLTNFLRLDVLSERLYGQKRSAVGRYERAFFDAAFKVLIEVKFEVPSMEPAWRG